MSWNQSPDACRVLLGGANRRELSGGAVRRSPKPPVVRLLQSHSRNSSFVIADRDCIRMRPACCSSVSSRPSPFRPYHSKIRFATSLRCPSTMATSGGVDRVEREGGTAFRGGEASEVDRVESDLSSSEPSAIVAPMTRYCVASSSVAIRSRIEATSRA